MKKMNKKNGFTLIELIIVMVILGIMAAVAVPRYMGTVSQAEAAAEKAVVDALKAAVENYATQEFLEKKSLHILIHPLWWTLEGNSNHSKLKTFFEYIVGTDLSFFPCTIVTSILWCIFLFKTLFFLPSLIS